MDTQHRIVSTGYNGPPAGFWHYNKPCTAWCPRAASAQWRDESAGEDFPDWAKSGFHGPFPDYSDCPALHAEANALLVCDRSKITGGTIYVTSHICYSCAKMIANSGLSDVVVRPRIEAAHRRSEQSYTLLEQCGLDVVIYEK